MRRLIAFGGFVFVVLSANAGLSACGEKFFFYGRVVKFQQMAAPVPGVVLMYTNPGSTLPDVLRQTKLDELLKRAGHKVEAIADAGALSQALKSGRYDVLLVDPADGDKWKTPGVVVVPVLYKPTKTEDRAAGKNYASVLKADKANDAIALVNNLIKARPELDRPPDAAQSRVTGSAWRYALTKNPENPQANLETPDQASTHRVAGAAAIESAIGGSHGYSQGLPPP